MTVIMSAVTVPRSAPVGVTAGRSPPPQLKDREVATSEPRSPRDRPSEQDRRVASAFGRYGGVLHALHVEEDREQVLDVERVNGEARVRKVLVADDRDPVVLLGVPLTGGQEVV